MAVLMSIKPRAVQTVVLCSSESRIYALHTKSQRVSISLLFVQRRIHFQRRHNSMPHKASLSSGYSTSSWTALTNSNTLHLLVRSSALFAASRQTVVVTMSRPIMPKRQRQRIRYRNVRTRSRCGSWASRGLRSCLPAISLSPRMS